MTEEQFAAGMAIVIANFPNLNPPKTTLKIWKGLLDDLAPEDYMRGVTAFCRTQTELYPGTNVVACIRRAFYEDLTFPEKLERIQATNIRLIEGGLT